MDIVLIEDEMLAMQNLERMIMETETSTKVLAKLQSVDEAVAWFEDHATPDAVFMDIHLADGLSFAIFDQVSIDCPIIFTTAYDQYALQAFKANGIDYLLKPINSNELKNAIGKIKFIIAGNEATGNLSGLISTLQQKQSYKTHFLIPIANRLQPLAATDIAYLYLENKLSVAYTFDGHKYTFDKPLDSIMTQLNPELFFRANRQFIIAHKAVKDINFWIGNKLHITLIVDTPERIIVSKARVSDFKNWYTEG